MSKERPYVLLVDPIGPEAKKWLKQNKIDHSYIEIMAYDSGDYPDILEFVNEKDRTLFALKWL